MGVEFPSLRAIFSTLLAGESSIDIRQCALTGSHILSAATLDHARFELEQAGFGPPHDIEHHELVSDSFGLGDLSSDGQTDNMHFGPLIKGADARRPYAIDGDLEGNKATQSEDQSVDGGVRPREGASKQSDGLDGIESTGDHQTKSSPNPTLPMFSSASSISGLTIASTSSFHGPKSAGSSDHKSVLAAHRTAPAKVVCAIAPPLNSHTRHSHVQAAPSLVPSASLGHGNLELGPRLGPILMAALNTKKCQLVG
jgi:hypothetical protein